ncbi:uncharacterized protein LOC110425343 [Herrania umbratica]|uniref:Uncharacterized protein LOC110425343 n=1 Tax=Herrania umbratica TaxID=108875 RepID=A0A6J1BBW9_9ROSI|nr:uncharacterized protein LOC110425343 [Herrania umbratica]
MAEAENKVIQTKNDNSVEPKNIFSMLPKIELKFPFFKQPSKNPEASVQKEEEVETLKPPSVFIGNLQKFPPPLEMEAEECIGRTSNPIVLWQVYAIGGFFFLKWIWARLKERKEMGGKKESSDDEQSPADDDSQYV